MPYIKRNDREKYLPMLAALAIELAGEPKGDLNYCVSMLAWEWARNHGVSYTNVSNAIGALLDAGAELRRRKLDPYEDKVCGENGDCYNDVESFMQRAQINH